MPPRSRNKMLLTREQVLEILYPGSVEGRTRRFTQDTPILPDVWLALAGNTTSAHPLLLTPHRQSSAAELAKHLRERMIRAGEPVQRITYNDSHVLAWLTFSQLIRIALPLSSWWARDLGKKHVSPEELKRFLKRPNFVELLMEPARQDDHGEFPENVLNFIRIIGCIALQEPIPPRAKLAAYLRRAVAKVQQLISGMDLDLVKPALWNIFTNRRATAALLRSRLTVKADAALQLFGINCKGVRVAVIDSGIDARHPAFRRENKEQESRVIKTLDFRRLQELTARDGEAAAHLKIPAKDRERIQKDIEKRLQDGRPLDWSVLEPALAIPQDQDYRPPVDEHGTHVAGIIGANWPENLAANGEPEPLVGMCPDIELYDLRVLDDAGEGDEFSILAALQYVRYLNQRSGRLVIHVVNISISLPHEPSSFACGATPICEEVNRLVSSGVVVVVAAGNSGYVGDSINNATDFRAMSLTDPGNAHQAITVGATHRSEPFRYGVSYFSSRGPTGDGRAKPDLVAPGEGIRSPIPGAQSVVLDGTSMAAPHVAGAAALLIARHRELAGDPERIKTILCRTATDLGRVRDFQGAGLLDILRALQSL